MLSKVEGDDKAMIIQLDTGTDGGGEAQIWQNRISGKEVFHVEVEIYMSDYYIKMRFNSEYGDIFLLKEEFFLSGVQRGENIKIDGRKNIPENYLNIYDRILNKRNDKQIVIEDLIK